MSPAPLRLVFDVQGELLQAARDCEADVFFAQFGNTADQLAQNYEKYEADTHFLAVVDEDDRVLAVSRLVFPGPGGFPTLDDIAGPPWNADPFQCCESAGIDLERTLDAATIAVRNGLRKQGFAASHALLYGIYAAMWANGLPWKLCINDAVPNQLLLALGLVYPTLPGTSVMPYYGSAASTPMYAYLPELMANQQRLAPLAHQAIGEGVGLNGVEVPAKAEFRLR